MSQQSVITSTIASLKEDAQKSFIENADKYLLQRFYGLGEGYCSSEHIDSAMIYDIISDNNCELLQMLQCELDADETIVVLNNEVKQSQDLIQRSEDALYELWLSQGNDGTKSQFLTLAFQDDSVSWEDIKW